MSIADKITRLQNAKTAIANAITGKGGTVSSGDGFEDFASDIGTIPEKEDATWNQCPTAVRNYLANVTYNPSDYTTSQIANYAPSTAVASNTKPIGKTIDGTTFYNEVPNVKTPFATTNKSGTIKPLDSLRWVNSSYAVNVRDIGGWTCDGGTVKYGLLFRGGEVTSADRNALVGDVDIRKDIDLRGTSAPNASPLGSDVYFVKTAGDIRYSLANTTDWTTVIRNIFDSVTHREPVYVHCSQGADRTGTVFFILELLLGMSQSDCDKDYELSCFGRNSSYWGTRATQAYIPALITELNAVYGNGLKQKVINWIFSLGFTDDEINAFRKAMIDGNPQDVHHTGQATNQVPISTDASGNIYNGSGYKDGYRLNSTGTESALTGSTMTGFIPCTKNDVVRVKGVAYTGTRCYVNLYDANKTHLSWVNNQPACGNTSFQQIHIPTADANGVYLVNDASGTGWVKISNYDRADEVAFIRLSAMGNGEDFIVTVNEPIE